ncbi:MAG: NADH:ubiquinone reductase (Na(+)-transporting) subunit A [Bacteroidales bacterium]|nr:NADH:ubiquinone reductase (Na(+)-transporting) subunit A [Bacteroidales bacterium]
MVKIKKGLDIPLDGIAERYVVDMRSVDRYAVKPPDVVGFMPRLLVAEGDTVSAGQPLIADKADPRLTLPSPVSGVVEAIVRGEKRKLLEVVVSSKTSLSSSTSKTSPTSTPSSPILSPDSPCWWMIKERPFGTIANPDHKPKGIYVSLRDTNPLAPDLDFALKGREHEFEAGVKALEAFAKVHCVKAEGPHPAGNIGTIVAALDPINKGECIWHVNAQDVANIGRWVTTGEYRPERMIAIGGPAAKTPHYYRVFCGACLKQIVEAQVLDASYPGLSGTQTPSSATRIISGSPLSGTTIAPDGFLGMYDQQVCFIEEGDKYDFMGWLMPGLKKFSFSKTFLSGFLVNLVRLVKLDKLGPSYNFNTNVHGSVRPFLFTGSFEQVFPFDIYPLQLIKACIVGDVELQEKLGIYEVEPEDFALCEFIDPSKTEIQTIIREALEVLRKEAIA